MIKVNLDEKFSQFTDYYNPRIVGELNGQHVKLAKLFGDFVWHKHDNEDEMFFVIKGELIIQFRDRDVSIRENEFIIVPSGVEHRPIANQEVWIMLFEPATTLNTGDVTNEFTKDNLERI